MLPEDGALMRRLRLERKTLGLARVKVGPYTAGGFRLADKIARLDNHIEGVEGRQPLEFWEKHQKTLEAAAQIEAHFPDAIEPLEVFDPLRRCRKCGGKSAVSWIESRLHRTCRRCAFSWIELPLDAAPDEAEVAQG